MEKTVFLFTPPFTQLNTPYPATAYLKGFLNTRGITSFQADLGIEVILALFCKTGLTAVFEQAALCPKPLSNNAARMMGLRQQYINTIDATIAFLQGKNPTLAHHIARRNLLPEASRFSQLADLEWAFGTMGIQDKAKHLATMYLEDISDFIGEAVDPHFGFSRYAERLARSANKFDELYQALQLPPTHTDKLLLHILDEHLKTVSPQLVAISVPFPGNVYSALRCGQFIKAEYPHIKIALGGGFANTELRTMSEVRVFEFLDFITLDDGEAPLEQLVKFINGHAETTQLKRTLLPEKNTADDAETQVVYKNTASCADYKQGEVGTPDYSDFRLTEYISALEIINPMHSLWSDGRWNKLTMAHGCYWGKCTFCDVSLPYISDYEPIAAKLLVDRMEEMMAQTGQSGFHFVDEAAPPALMRSISIEILKRQLTVSWWTNVRFEKSFTRDLCLLLKAAGCIGVSGGLEVASDRLLELIQKGITVAQVARVNQHFTQAGVMVHAYLMYGFPTQTAQETIDSLDMVRQMFKAGVLQSGFWHQFAMTAHSPVGLNPADFKVEAITDGLPSFANNDVEHRDPTGADHSSFSFGLKKSLLNYMHHIGYDEPLQKWFDHKVPKPKVDANYIENILNTPQWTVAKPTSRVVFVGSLPKLSFFVKSKKGNQWPMATLEFNSNTDALTIETSDAQGQWLFDLLPMLQPTAASPVTMQAIKTSYEGQNLPDFELFWDNKPINLLYKMGLLVV
ncbi:MAG: radical SAM protein [Bacteroidetes bacterium]|nr:MAG: radical SAM protein [Bacteroidota bacterium]